MTTTMPRPRTVDLVRFVLTRLEEDEAQLKRLLHETIRAGRQPADAGVLAVSRQLAEVEAKRRILASVQRLIALRDQPMEKAVRDEAALVLKALSTPYLQHPAYRAEWRAAGTPRPVRAPSP
jgi:hypothetical protein